MPCLYAYAALAWLGHLFALYAIMQYAWDGFTLAAAIDLPLQLGLMHWLWRQRPPRPSRTGYARPSRRYRLPFTFPDEHLEWRPPGRGQ